VSEGKEAEGDSIFSCVEGVRRRHDKQRERERDQARNRGRIIPVYIFPHPPHNHHTKETKEPGHHRPILPPVTI